MLAANLGLVHHHHVAGREAIEPVACYAVGDRNAEIGEEDRQPAAVLRDHARLRVDQPAAEIAHLVDHHVVGGLGERVSHLVGIGHDGVAHDLDRDRMGFVAVHCCPASPSATSMMRCPASVTVATSPGWMSVVAFGSSITAGPSMRAPAASDGRQTTRVGTGFAASVKMTSRVPSATGGSGCQGCASHCSASISAFPAVTTSRTLTHSSRSSGAAWP